MSLIPYVRQQVVQQLWQGYLQRCPSAQRIINALAGMPVVLDHLAIIDIPSKNTGIATLNQIFAALDYLPQGRDYLADKQNEFMWLAPADVEKQNASEALPQIVIADFALDEMPASVAAIVEKYAAQTMAFNWRVFHQLCGRVYRDDQNAAEELINIIVTYSFHKDWASLTSEEHAILYANNELLAWVLTHGRMVNHFGIAVHLLDHYSNLESFNQFVLEELQIALNTSGGVIKGNQSGGILQSSTQSNANEPFMEFVWRIPQVKNPVYWKDYFTGFIGTQANYVIESVFERASG